MSDKVTRPITPGCSLIWFAAVTELTVADDEEQLPSGPIRRRAWIIAFTGFFLLIGAWALAAPYNGSPDEAAHAVRAAGVAAGQVVAPAGADSAGGGAYQTVPRSLFAGTACWQFDPSKPASCAQEPGRDTTPIRVQTPAGRYHPWYYAIVGGPLLLLPNWTGVILARLITAALCAALLAMALLDAMRWSRYRFVAAGVLAAATPMAAMCAGAINPSGPEIAAGIAFFAAAVPLFHAKSAERSRTLLWHTGIAGLTLVSLRAGGPLWFSVAIASLLLPWRWTTLRGLWGWRAARWWGLGIGVAMLVSVTWTELLHATYMGDFTRGTHNNPVEAILLESEMERGYVDQMVGVGSWLDTRLPSSVYLVWESIAAALILGGFILANRLGRWRLSTLAVAGLGIPFAMQILWVNKYGFITQGRYLLPVAAGLPILGAFLIQQHGVSATKSRAVLRSCVVTLLPLHLVFLWYTMVRWQHGIDWRQGLAGLNPLAGPWHPPLGSLLPLVASVVGILAVGWLVWDGASVGSRRSTSATEPPADQTQHHGFGDRTNGSGTPRPEDAEMRSSLVASDAL
jgi:hypothetical protein